ncbi:MAG: hypothetical protein ABJB74_16375 [Gemmatimonas sp.]
MRVEPVTQAAFFRENDQIYAHWVDRAAKRSADFGVDRYRVQQSAYYHVDGQFRHKWKCA